MHCPAKINLFLKLINKRPDGYHDLESVFAFLDLYDELDIKKSDKFQLEILGEFAEFVDLENNLFTKVLDYFVKEFAISRNIKITVKKNIPVGAGLGGGSSNAAFFMMALNDIFALNLDKKTLQKIALDFGSDIPFFFEKRAVIIRGRGEIIGDYYDFASLKILLVNPKIHVATKEIFRNFDNNFSAEISDAEIKKMNILQLINLPNDLTKPAIASCGVIAEILSKFQKLKAIAAKMSGSGATCFAVFENDDDLEFAKRNFEKEFSDYFVKEVNIICNV